MHSPLRHLGSILWKRRPIQLTFFVTRKCNARCPFCFYLAGADPPATHVPELSLPEIEQAGKLAREPVVAGLLRRRDLFAQRPRRDQPDFLQAQPPGDHAVPTNGLLPELIATQTERILRTCANSVVAVKLSLDGVGEAHDRLRGTPGGFAKVMQTYERLAPLLARYPNFELGVNTVFCHGNQERMDDIVDFVAGPQTRAHAHDLAGARRPRGRESQTGGPRPYISARSRASNTARAPAPRPCTASAARASRRPRTSCNDG